MNKKLVQNIDAVSQSAYQLIFRIPFFILAAIMTWKYTNNLVPYILFFGVLDTIDIIIYFWALKILDATTFELLNMSNIIITLFFGAVIGLEIIENSAILGIMLFLISITMVMDIRFKDIKGLSSNKEIITAVIRVLELLVKTYKMFLIKKLIVDGAGSNETIIFLSTLVQITILLIVFKPRINFKEINCWVYVFQGFLSMVATMATGYAIVSIGVVPLNIVKTSSTIMLAVVYAIVDRKLPSLKKSAGIVLGTLSLIIVIL